MALIIALSALSEVINLVWKVVSERNIFTSLGRHQKKGRYSTKRMIPLFSVLLSKKFSSASIIRRVENIYIYNFLLPILTRD